MKVLVVTASLFLLLIAACSKGQTPDQGPSDGCYTEELGWEGCADESYAAEAQADLEQMWYDNGYHDGRANGLAEGYDEGYFAGCEALGEALVADGVLDWYECER